MTIDITQKEIEGLARIHCTEREMAAYFDCNHNTIGDYCRRNYGCDFKTFAAKFADQGKISLRRKAWQMALKGHWEPLKMLMKNHLEMEDAQEVHNTHEAPGGGPVQTAIVPMTLDELRAEAERRGLPTSVFEKGDTATAKSADIASGPTDSPEEK